jgi:predicted glycosyltransferase
MNEDQIERRVEKMTNHYDRLLIHGDWTQEDYDKAMHELAQWAEAKASERRG